MGYIGTQWDTLAYRGNSVGYRGITWEVGDIPFTPWKTVVGLWDTVGYRGKLVGSRENVYTVGYSGIPWETCEIP